MTGNVHEIRLTGHLPPGVAARVGVVEESEEPAQTVLVLDDVDPGTLQRVVTRLQDLGLELREIRQRPPRAGPGPRRAAAGPPEGATYEVRVTGLVGPVTRCALPAAVAIHVPRMTRVVVAQEGRDLVRVLQTLDGAGLQLDSVRVARRPDHPGAGRPCRAAGVTREG